MRKEKARKQSKGRARTSVLR